VPPGTAHPGTSPRYFRQSPDQFADGLAEDLIMKFEDTLSDIVPCPEPSCQAPADVVDRFVLPSTGGPVAHVKTFCVNGHVFTPRVESLPAWSAADVARAFGAAS
jgi:hypothetical protein